MAGLLLPEAGYSGLNRFETFETHHIHVKLPYSAGLPVVQLNRFETLETNQIHLKVPNKADDLLVI